jgi:hypothetical protein
VSIYAFPSFIALIIKAWLFWFGRYSLITTNKPLGFFLSALFCLNLAEFNLFFYVDNAEEAMPIMRFYWASAILSVSSFLYLSGLLSGHRIYITPLWFFALVMLLYVMFSELLIAGTESINYSVTRIKGDYYILLVVYVLFHLFLGLGFLINSSMKHQDKWVRKKCTVVSLAMIPTILAVTTVLVLMQLGIKINATTIVSLTIIIFLFALIYTEEKYSLLNILVLFPTSKESIILRKILALLVDYLYRLYNKRTIKFKVVIKEIESVLVQAALEENEKDKDATAEQLCLHKNTINNKIKNTD